MWYPRTQFSTVAAAASRQRLTSSGGGVGSALMRTPSTTTTTTTSRRWATTSSSSNSPPSGGPSSTAPPPSTTAFGFKDFTASASSFGQADAKAAAQQRQEVASPAMIAVLLSNPATARKVVEGLSESARRRLTMIASNEEWEMDHSNDHPPSSTSSPPPSTTTTTGNSSGLLSGSREKLKAAERVLKGVRSGEGKDDNERSPNLHHEGGDVSAVEHREWARQVVSRRATGGTGSSRDINWRVLVRIGLQAACPFIAFGMLDNSLMVMSGDLIDSLVGERFDLPIMAAAAMGGIVSGTMGIQMHGLADRLVQKYGPSRPRLTPQEWRMPKTKRTIHWAGTFGLIVGLSLGMFPLYFLD